MGVVAWVLRKGFEEVTTFSPERVLKRS